MPPQLVFIVPYRDREQQLAFFRRHMSYVLEDYDPSTYDIVIVQQCDTRDFNRGAMKNIGFLAMKDKYPDDYQHMTFVFNDVDTMPFTKNFLNYPTTQGIVKHFYGWTFALGGIFSITGADFERSLGFPNLWAWGFEDNMMQDRVTQLGLTIDRNQFYPIADKNIFQFSDNIIRTVNRTEFDRFQQKTHDGLTTLRNVNIQHEDGFVNVYGFDCETPNRPELNIIHDLRAGNVPFKNKSKRMGMHF
jgi:hypothetical protein